MAANDIFPNSGTRSFIYYKQLNGCKYYGPRLEDLDRTAPSGTEVFVGKIPPVCDGEEIFGFFSSVGKVYDVRMYVNYNGLNRGFGYVRYYSRDHAQTAVDVLNRKSLRPLGKPNYPLFVGKSTDHRTLVLYGLASGLLIEEIEKVSLLFFGFDYKHFYK